MGLHEKVLRRHTPKKKKPHPSDAGRDMLPALRDIADENGRQEDETLTEFLRSKCRQVRRLEAECAALRNQLVVECSAGERHVEVMNELTSLRAKIESGIKLTVTAE